MQFYLHDVWHWVFRKSYHSHNLQNEYSQVKFHLSKRVRSPKNWSYDIFAVIQSTTQHYFNYNTSSLWHHQQQNLTYGGGNFDGWTAMSEAKRKMVIWVGERGEKARYMGAMPWFIYSRGWITILLLLFLKLRLCIKEVYRLLFTTVASSHLSIFLC